MTRRHSGSREALVVALVVCALVLPFADRPLHVDDEVYVRGAAPILAHPLDPLGGTQRMLGEVMPTYRFTQHPPLVSAAIALVLRASGRTVPWQLHLVFVVFPLLAALAMLHLSRRFARYPLATTLLMVATPAFLVSSHGLMTDVPLLAFALGAVAALVSGVDEDRHALIGGAGALLALAMLTQYRALVLAPLFPAYALLQRKRLAPAALAALASLLVLGLWSWWNWATLGVLHVLDAGGIIPLTPERVLRDGIAYVSYLGGATAFPLFLVFAVRRRLRRPAVAAFVATATAVVLWRWAPDHRGVQAWLLLLFCSIGLATLLGLVPDRASWREALAPAEAGERPAPARDDLFLLAAATLVLASQVLLNLFASVRSLLLALPFLILLLVRRLESEAATEGSARRRLAAGVVATAALGLAVAFGDYRLAVAERDLGADVPCPGKGCRVWFSGEWGFRYAMERRGYEYLVTNDNSPRAGDAVVMPDVPCPSDLHPALLRRLRLKGVRESGERFPIKVVSFRDHAGFYSDFFGLLPYSFSLRPVDRIRIFEVISPEEPGGGDVAPAQAVAGGGARATARDENRRSAAVTAAAPRAMASPARSARSR